MTHLTPSIPSEPTRMTVVHYLGLVEAGVLGPDDSVELLEGVVVAMAPQNPAHAACVARADGAVVAAIPTVHAAAPGIRTYADLTLITARYVPLGTGGRTR